MLHTSRIEISKSALQKNLKFIHELIGPNCKFSSVVKGNAYGHGISTYVPLAEELGVNHFSVFSASEANNVFQSSSSNPTIMIMGMLDSHQLEWAIENELEFYVFDLDRLEKAIQIATKQNKIAKIHLELETGMNRTGIQEFELERAIQLLQSTDRIQLIGLCTHYAGAESIANYYRIEQQKSNFKRLHQMLKVCKVQPSILHTACSAATLRYPETQMDLVRIGILQYGFFPGREVLVDYQTKNQIRTEPLQRLISWKSNLMDVREVTKGEFIGYGTSYLANEDMTIGLVPVGYCNGFSRSLSNQGRVLIRGQRMSVIGMVNMNMMAIDLTTIENPQKGEEIILIGQQGESEISVASFSEFSDQVNYELLTRLPHNIPRIQVD